MCNNAVDISHTLKASDRNGRRLFRNLDTGEVFWEGEEDVIEELPELLKPTKPRRKRKDSEGDK
jgi:hypothetical protein